MVKAEEVQHGGVPVAEVDGVFDNVVGEVIGLAMNNAAFDATATHPDGVTAGVVVASIVFFGESALGINRATELAAPDDERFVEQAALFEVLNETVAGLIDVAALIGQPPGNVGVRVPIVVINLYKADAAFDESAG